jgi:uncharacterized protein YecA (UPF0149 family)
MSTEAQFKANQTNAAKSTGPTSDAGKANAAKNHLIHGLYTRLDYVKPEERDIYKIFYETMFADLGPVTTLEQSYANEIAGASWRLRRCSAVEGELADYRTQDPMFDEKAEKTIRSLERARTSALSLLNRAINQLRKLQTERITRVELDWDNCNFPPLADTRKLQLGLMSHYRLDKQMLDLKKQAEAAEARQVDEAMQAIMNEPGPNWADIDLQPEQTKTESEELASNCTRVNPTPKPAPEAPTPARTRPCPCKSGKKYKHCCAKKPA